MTNAKYKTEPTGKGNNNHQLSDPHISPRLTSHIHKTRMMIPTKKAESVVRLNSIETNDCSHRFHLLLSI